MTFIVVTFILTLVVLAYAVAGRRWLKRQTWPWSVGFFRAIEPVEIRLWGKSETLLWTRYISFMGTLYGFLTWLGALDVTPFLSLMPDAYRPWVTAAPFAAVVLGGVVGEVLRRGSSQPLEMVAVPDNSPLQVAVLQADLAKNAAVAEIVAANAAPPQTVTPDKE